ncbi:MULTISPECIES: primosomal protein DnaI [Abiotrophia]|jgi:hypothetical protein|uniref:primosomal protein DnaI n=1 Tax=Abiotrophia TaxID=46123 RepID=UPI001CAAC4E7|nr:MULTISPECIES: primosomal protein DnaI [Abiotrophia]MBF0941777.1 primosomal protein DnaI [Abiotrophia sp.]
METIQDVMRQIMNQPHLQEIYEQAVALVRQDEAIQAFLREHQAELSGEMIQNSLSKLNEFRLERRAIEAGQPGTNPGYQPELFINHNFIDVRYKPTTDYLASLKARRQAANLDNRMMADDVRQAHLADYIIDSPERQALINAVTQFMQTYHQDPKSAQGLYITGPYGVGKTYLLGALANHLVEEEGATVTFLHFPTFASDMRASIRDNSTQANLDKVKQVDVLMLDDMGAESDPSGWVRDEVLAIILEYRMRESLPTFFTSNFSLKEYEEVLTYNQKGISLAKAGRIMERVRYLAREITLDGPNRRQLKRQG